MNFEMKLKNAIPQAMYQLECAGIRVGDIHSIKVNNRLKGCFGRTIRHRFGSAEWYEIEIAGMFKDSTDDKNGLMDTLIHELLHTCRDCYKHTGQWKAYAERMNKLYGYRISRTSSYEDCGLKRPEVRYKYRVYCPECGAEWKYQKASRCVQKPENFKCGCGHKGLKVESL